MSHSRSERMKAYEVKIAHEIRSIWLANTVGQAKYREWLRATEVLELAYTDMRARRTPEFDHYASDYSTPACIGWERDHVEAHGCLWEPDP